MRLTFYILLWIEGGNDIIASKFDISVNGMTWFMRGGACIILPPIAFIVTKRVCFGLQRHDRDKLLHGYESGVIKRLPDGGFVEVHRPVDEEARAVLEAKKVPASLPAPGAEDENGVPASSRGAVGRLRSRVNRAFAETIVVEANGNGHRAGEAGAHVVVGPVGEAARRSARPGAACSGHSPGDDPPARSRATISAGNARTMTTSPGLPGRSSNVAHLPGMAPSIPGCAY